MLRNRKGFTLIELLIVVVIIGILAAIAIPKFASTKEKAYLATMKSDLRNLATAQEGYFADAKTYFSGTASNNGTGTTVSLGGGYVPSSGVTVVEVEREVATDSYRIRRLISQWLEQGALVAA